MALLSLYIKLIYKSFLNKQQKEIFFYSPILLKWSDSVYTYIAHCMKNKIPHFPGNVIKTSFYVSFHRRTESSLLIYRNGWEKSFLNCS